MDNAKTELKAETPDQGFTKEAPARYGVDESGVFTFQCHLKMTNPIFVRGMIAQLWDIVNAWYLNEARKQATAPKIHLAGARSALASLKSKILS